MQTHELLLHDPIPPEVLKRSKRPAYDKDRGTPAYLLSEDAQSVYQVVMPEQVFVPLVERGEHSLPDLAMALIEAALVNRSEPVAEAGSFADAIIAGAEAMKLKDLQLHSILVRTGTAVPADGVPHTAYHDDVEPGLVICLPEPQYLGSMPTADDTFGMIVHNPGAIVPVRIVG